MLCQILLAAIRKMTIERKMIEGDMSDFTLVFLCLIAIRKMTIERKTIEGGMSDVTLIFLCCAAIRKMTIERKTIEGGMHRRDIVSDYSDYASQVYAPLARIGVFLDRGSEQYVVKSRYLSSYQGTCGYITTLTLSDVFPPTCQGLISV